MDSCVLIPPEFGLVMVSRPDHVFEMSATLWTRRVIVPGMEFFPDRGEIRLDRLEVFSRIQKSDIRTKYGCTEDIWSVDGTEVRHCNWVRFLRTCSDPAEANLIGSKVDNHTIYKVTKCVPPNTEIVAYLQPTENTAETDEVCEEEIMEIEAKRIKLEPKETPEDMRIRYSPVSPVLPCSPVSRDDECFSGASDDASVDLRTERSRSKSDSSTDDSLTAMDLTLARPLAVALPSSVLPTIRRNRERTWLPCEVCGKKFDRPSLLKRHMRTHTGEKPHACDVCGKAFSTSSSLNTHRRIHSGEKPHQCQICGKCFTASSNLYYHRMTHNKEKPHKCNMCSKSFPTPGDLKSHMYVHNGSWPFKCDICNRGFSKQTNLKNHLILHTGEKPYECHLCSKKFALQCNLKTHIKSHETDAQEECGKCGKNFLESSKQLYNGMCKSCFCGSPEAGRLSEKITNPSPSRISDFSISSLTSGSKRDSPVSSNQSTPSRRSSIGNSTPPTPTLAFPVPINGAHAQMGSPYFQGSLPVSPFPMMPSSPPMDRQLYLQGLYTKVMGGKSFSSPTAMHDGYYARSQIPLMASHY